jgi:hypothetical protein
MPDLVGANPSTCHKTSDSWDGTWRLNSVGG